MQTPFWLPWWQAADSILRIATESALVLPVMVLICFLLGRRNQRIPMAHAGRLFLATGLVTGLFGALTVAGQGYVSLQAIPAAMDKLVPVPFEPFARPWLATTTGFLSWIFGLVLMVSCWLFAKPCFSTACVEMDEKTEKAMQTRAIFASTAALAAFFCFGASMILRSWPFLGLPEQMTQEVVMQVLMKNTWQTACSAFMPAGALSVLTFFLQLPARTRQERRDEREHRSKEVIPGTVEDLRPFTRDQQTTVRMCAAFALAGAAFQLMDASFLAFSSMATMNGGTHGLILRFGPFIVSAASLTCWGFIFAKPRRHQLFLALLPVLLIFFRAAGNF